MKSPPESAKDTSVGNVIYLDLPGLVSRVAFFFFLRKEFDFLFTKFLLLWNILRTLTVEYFYRYHKWWVFNCFIFGSPYWLEISLIILWSYPLKTKSCIFLYTISVDFSLHNRCFFENLNNLKWTRETSNLFYEVEKNTLLCMF